MRDGRMSHRGMTLVAGLAGALERTVLLRMLGMGDANKRSVR